MERFEVDLTDAIKVCDEVAKVREDLLAVRALKQEQDAAYEMSLEQDKQKDVPKPNTSSGVSGPCGSTTVHPCATTSTEQSSNVQTVTVPPESESSRQASEEVQLPSSFSDSPASTESNTENAPSDSDMVSFCSDIHRLRVQQLVRESPRICRLA